MRALLITLEGIEEVQIGADVEKTRAVLANTPVSDAGGSLETMQRLIGCTTITGTGYPDHAHACYADDEGLFKLDDGSQVNIVSWCFEELMGKLLITGFDPETGETIPATMDVDDLRSMVKVGELRYE
jgi:hypothetical protein